MDQLEPTLNIVATEKERFENFKLGNPMPVNGAAHQRAKHGHARSHSRNNSISAPFSSSSSSSLPVVPFTFAQKTATSTNINDLSRFTLPLTNHNGATKPHRPVSLPPLVLPSSNPGLNQNSAASSVGGSAALPPAQSCKRNSHHRRRSSVSTRHESAELMGMSVPDLPPSTSEDNINLGEKDSIRRRALLALEGKADIAFSKVEIPDFSTSDMDKAMSKSSLTQTSSVSYGNGLNLMNNKRDSFKLLGNSASSKDQLHTLVEEEEEEEDEQRLQTIAKAEDSLPSPAPSIKENIPPTLTPSVAVQPSRPALNLRPLSLTPENLMTLTPSPSPRSGLRSLSLAPSPAGQEDLTSTNSIKQLRRCSRIISPTPSSKRPVLNLSLAQLDSSPPNGEGEEKKIERRSSISYKRSSTGVTVNAAGLPTPEMTPTFGRRFSTSGSMASCNSISSNSGNSEEDFMFSGPPTQARPLSTSEQHFLFKSHHALLARITDLEKALSMRRQDTRPLSVSSNVSSTSEAESRSAGCGSAAEGPSDEMLRLIADLKAERDELKRDVDGWRQRVNNLENQTAVFAKRVEAERREAWVARSKAGVLEVELTRKFEAVDELVQCHEKEKGIWEEERSTLEKEMEEYKSRVEDLEDELKMVKKELETERAMAKTLLDPMATPTPMSNRSFENIVRPVVVISPPSESTVGSVKTHGLGFMSVDSESSTTDVERDSFDAFGYPLKAVQEEDFYGSEEENGLAGYEEEDEMDDLSLPSSASYESEDLNRPVKQHQFVGRLPSPTTPTNLWHKPLPPAPAAPTHASQSSLSMNWTFPKAVPPVSTVKKDKTDQFFDCLDDSDSEVGGTIPSSPSGYSYEKSKGLFSRGFAFAPENDNASFFLPSGVGIPAVGEERTQLEVVTEEEEEEGDFEGDEDMFGEIGGIKITFTPPQAEDDEEEEEEEEEEKQEPEQIQVSPPRQKRISPPPVLPALNFGEGDPFSFGRPLLEERMPSPPAIPVKSVSIRQVSTRQPPPPSHPALAASAPSVVEASSSGASISSSSSSRSSISSSRCTPFSMIPCPSSPSVARQSNSGGLPTPPKGPRSPSPPSISLESFPSPPTKRSPSPSFIPQPVSAPSLRRTRHSTPPKPSVATPMATFIRQPSSRKPPLPSNSKSAMVQTPIAGSSNVPLSLDGKMNVHMTSSPISFNTSTSERRAFAAFINSFVGGKSSKNSTLCDSQIKNVGFTNDDLPTHKCTPPDIPATFTAPSSSSPTPIFSSVTSSSSSSSPPQTQTPTRFSFQTLTNFVPWASRNSPVSTNRSVPPNPPAVNIAPRFSNTRGSSNGERRRYVPREEQLWRLRARMEAEGVERMKSCVHVHCKKCIGEIVLF